jgi:pyruvate dehydrogenase phosphatase
MPPASENAPEWEARLTDMGWGGKYGPYLYKLLHEPRLSRELARQADARSVCGVHCVALQPCPDPDERSQDRYVVQNWDLSPGADGDRGDGADWKFLAVFDGELFFGPQRSFMELIWSGFAGHGGEDLAEYAMIALPPLVRFALSSALLADAAPQAPPQLPARISSVLSDTLVAFDDAIARDITSLFPDRVEQLLALSDEQIRAIIGGGDGDDGETLRKVVRGMCGTTAVVALLDPERRNLWVASLGDSQAGECSSLRATLGLEH